MDYSLISNPSQKSYMRKWKTHRKTWQNVSSMTWVCVDLCFDPRGADTPCIVVAMTPNMDA